MRTLGYSFALVACFYSITDAPAASIPPPCYCIVYALQTEPNGQYLYYCDRFDSCPSSPTACYAVDPATPPFTACCTTPGCYSLEYRAACEDCKEGETKGKEPAKAAERKKPVAAGPMPNPKTSSEGLSAPVPSNYIPTAATKDVTVSIDPSMEYLKVTTKDCTFFAKVIVFDAAPGSQAPPTATTKRYVAYHVAEVPHGKTPDSVNAVQAFNETPCCVYACMFSPTDGSPSIPILVLRAKH